MTRLLERPDSDFGFDKHLPPLDAYKVEDPRKIKKFYVPTDDRGFVMPEEAVHEIKNMFYDDYEWPVNPRISHARPNSHHLHWYKGLYDWSLVARGFRESRQVNIPNQVHRVWHEYTLPPNRPRFREMRREVAALALKSRLLDSARRLDKLNNVAQVVDERPDVADAIYDMVIHQLDRQERGLAMQIGAFREHTATRDIDLSELEELADQELYAEKVLRILGVTGLKSANNYMHLFKTKTLEPADDLAMAG